MGVGLGGLRQYLYSIMMFHALLSYPVSTGRAHHGWAQRKIFNIRVLRWPENAILGVFVVNRVQKKYPHLFSQKGKSPPSPLLLLCCRGSWLSLENYELVASKLFKNIFEMVVLYSIIFCISVSWIDKYRKC